MKVTSIKQNRQHVCRAQRILFGHTSCSGAGDGRARAVNGQIYCQINMPVTLSVEVPTPPPCCQGVRQVETTRGGAIFKSLFDFLNVQMLTFFCMAKGAGRRWLTRHKLRRQTPLTAP